MKEYAMTELAKMSQQELINVGLNPDEFTAGTRMFVTRYLDFQKALEEMAFNDPDLDVRIEATKRILDEEVLLKIALRGGDTAFYATDGIEDQKKLKRILASIGRLDEGRGSEARLCANVLRNLDVRSNQYIFEKIALDDDISIELRWTAILRTKNKNLLQQLKTVCDIPIQNGNSIYIRGLILAAEQTLNRLEHKAFLKAKYANKLFEIKYDFMEGNILKELRLEEVCQLNDQKTLEMIALNSDEYADIKCKAISKINNQKVLIQIALNSEEYWKVRFTAIRRITDQNVLSQIVLSDKTTWPERFEAVRKITDQNILRQVALHDADYNVKVEAIYHLTDKTVLKQIAENEEEVIKKEAKQRLTELK